jgi:hypothetical protein
MTQWEHAHTHAKVVLDDVWQERDSRSGKRIVDVVGLFLGGTRGPRVAIRSRDRKVRRRLVKGCLRYVNAPAFVKRFLLLTRKAEPPAKTGEAVQPWHDSSACPSCSAPCAAPLCRRDTPTDRTFENPATLWCPLCGHTWDESDTEVIARAWWSLGAHEAKSLIGDAA